MTIKLHTDKCLSCGTCVAMAPSVCSLDTGTITLKKNSSDLTEEEQKQVQQAAAMCPNSAIEVTEN